jgi:hypothetical protein
VSARSSCVTACFVFFPERVCETLLRYRLLCFFPRAGMRDALALPLASFFSPSGYARHSCVTACFVFFLERVCETLSRYRLLCFFPRVGMRDTLVLPLALFFSSSGYARRSRVTACFDFFPERVCETLSRYRLLCFFPRAGMRDALALPLASIFSPSGYARHSRVTACFVFFLERVCETLSRYRLLCFFPQAGMRGTPALPFYSILQQFGHDRHSSITYSILPKFGHDGRSSVTFPLDSPTVQA